MILSLLLYLALSVFDAWFTAKRIPQLGVEAEYNLFIRWLSYKFGIKTGIYFGVLSPTVVILILGTIWPCLLIYLLGCRTTLFAFQLKAYYDKRTE